MDYMKIEKRRYFLSKLLSPAYQKIFDSSFEAYFPIFLSAGGLWDLEAFSWKHDDKEVGKVGIVFYFAPYLLSRLC